MCSLFCLMFSGNSANACIHSAAMCILHSLCPFSLQSRTRMKFPLLPLPLLQSPHPSAFRTVGWASPPLGISYGNDYEYVSITFLDSSFSLLCHCLLYLHVNQEGHNRSGREETNGHLMLCKGSRESFCPLRLQELYWHAGCKSLETFGEGRIGWPGTRFQSLWLRELLPWGSKILDSCIRFCNQAFITFTVVVSCTTLIRTRNS